MESGYEKRILALYIDRLIRRVDRRSPAVRALIDWLRDHEAILEIDVSSLNLQTAKPKGRRIARSSSGLDEEIWQRLTRCFAGRARAFRRLPLSLIEKNLTALLGTLDLDETERKIVEAVTHYCTSNAVENFFDCLTGTRLMSSHDVLSAILDIPTIEISRRLSQSGLIAQGLICPYNSLSPEYFQFGLPNGLRSALSPPHQGLQEVERALIGAALKSDLFWEDYDHIAEERDFAADLLKGAVARREKGVNILIYGPPGTGKTALCRVLAARLGLSLYAVGESNASGLEPGREERLAALQIGQHLMRSRCNSALLFDEMEDVLNNGRYVISKKGWYVRAGSKVFINRLLEENETPTLWTSNSIESFDPALLRRMSFSLELRLPPVKVRERMWGRLIDTQKMALPGDTARKLAQRFEISPGLAAAALRSTALADGDNRQLGLAVTALTKSVEQGRLPRPAALPGKDFDPRLVQADVDLGGLSQQMARPEAPRDVSLCLYGPPGTGKSAYLRHLAGAMGFDVLQKRASDLISMWVGQSEENIAEAFAEARANRQFLIFDEADSLLYDRAGAQRSFEVSQVNEMLTWMEVHDLPFACTTNLMENLDRAALRRFAFKVKFGYLTPAQNCQAFRLYFGLEAPPPLGDLQLLTPGDYAVVARKLRFLPGDRDPGQIAALLEQECRLKPGQTQSMGFRMAQKAQRDKLARSPHRD